MRVEETRIHHKGGPLCVCVWDGLCHASGHSGHGLCWDDISLTTAFRVLRALQDHALSSLSASGESE